MGTIPDDWPNINTAKFAEWEEVRFNDQDTEFEDEVKKLITESNDLYGSIKPTEISKLIKINEKIDVKPSSIQPLKEIKSIGTFKVKINLHSDIQAEIKIKVISEDSIK